jgi:hypothetical protein
VGWSELTDVVTVTGMYGRLFDRRWDGIQSRKRRGRSRTVCRPCLNMLSRTLRDEALTAERKDRGAVFDRLLPLRDAAFDCGGL